MNRILIYFLLSFVITLASANLIFSQPPDSENVISKERSIEILKNLIELADSYYPNDIKTFKVYVDSARNLVESSNHSVLAKIYHYYGDYYDRIGHYDSAIVFYTESINYSELMNDQIELAKSTSKIGRMYYKSGKYDIASRFLFEAVIIAEKIKNLPVMALCYQNLGHLSYGQKNFEDAIRFQKLGREIHLVEGNLHDAGVCAVNIGNAYNQLGNNDSALYYQHSALNQFVLEKDTLSQSYPINNIALIYNNIGEYEKSIEYLKKGLAIRLKYNEPRGISFGYNYIALNYRGMGAFNKAIENYLKSVDHAIPINYYQLLKNSYEGLSICFDSLAQYKNAYAYHKLMTIVSDTLFNRQKIQELADAQTKYESEKKEQQIELLDTQNALQAADLEKNQLFFIAAMIAFLAITFFGYLFFKQHNYKLIMRFEQERSKLKSDEIKAVITSQENERKRFAMDLHDNFGQLISAMRLLVNQSSNPNIKSNDLLDKMYSSLKDIAFDLMPHTLVEKGLDEAMDELFNQLNFKGGIKFEYKSFTKEHKLEKTTEIAIYRIVQEISSNIIKYAEAKNVIINLTELEDSFNIMIEDDGKGFDVSEFYFSKGNGWKNIRSRLDLVNGEFNIDSAQERKGTTFSISIPFINDLEKAA